MNKGTTVTLVRRKGKEEITLTAMILDVITHPSFTGPDNQPALTLVYLKPEGADAALRGPYWHDAFEQLTGVKHVTHPDFVEGRETLGWFLSEAEEQVARISDYLHRNFGEEIDKLGVEEADDVANIVLALLRKAGLEDPSQAEIQQQKENPKAPKTE